MTTGQFGLALLGDPAYTVDGRNRVRYLVADALDVRAKERRADGRPDVAGRLIWAANRIRHGEPLTKRVASKLGVEIAAVEQLLVDGVVA